MKIYGFISISGVISETAKHKTGLFPLRPGEPDRMTRLSALAEQGSCGAWKWDLVGGSEVGGSDGEDLMFGLATMAAVCYLSSSSALMRLSTEMEEERRGHEEVEKRRTEECTTTHLPHTPLSPPLLITATLTLEDTQQRSCITEWVHIHVLSHTHTRDRCQDITIFGLLDIFTKHFINHYLQHNALTWLYSCLSFFPV